MDMAKGAGVATIGIMTPNEEAAAAVGPDGLPLAPLEGEAPEAGDPAGDPE